MQADAPLVWPQQPAERPERPSAASSRHTGDGTEGSRAIQVIIEDKMDADEPQQAPRTIDDSDKENMHAGRNLVRPQRDVNGQRIEPFLDPGSVRVLKKRGAAAKPRATLPADKENPVDKENSAPKYSMNANALIKDDRSQRPAVKSILTITHDNPQSWQGQGLVRA